MVGVLSMSQFRSPSSTSSEIDGGNQFTYGVQGTAGGRGWPITSGNGKRLVSGIFRSRSSNYFGTDLDSKTELCRLSLQ